MTAAVVLRLPYAAYLVSEAAAAQKREYWDGFLVAMAGGSVRHASRWMSPGSSRGLDDLPSSQMTERHSRPALLGRANARLWRSQRGEAQNSAWRSFEGAQAPRDTS